MNNLGRPVSTIEDLRRQRANCLIKSEKAITKYTGQYNEMKRVLEHIVSNKIDTDEYDYIACRLSKLIKKMGPSTIFYSYYYENIDPKQNGSAKYFRFVCRDLLEQICELDRWRIDKRKLSLIMAN